MGKVVNWVMGVFMVSAFVILFYFGIYSVPSEEKSADEIRQQKKLDTHLSEINSQYMKEQDKDEPHRQIVQTLSGDLVGERIKVFKSKIYAFLGIPYAEPPIGNLRFSSPEPVKSWKGIRPALEFTPMCPQIIIPSHLMTINYITRNISEDCLTLNIWSPEIKPKQLKTVMVWIHGGGFTFNSANIHETDGRVLSLFGDVVVVTINYRIGAFGFLNTRNEGAPGNMGIYDQTLALQWIKDNIKQFGGDPEKIVPFGQSAGAISIGILMTYNKTKDLFSRAITQSGSFLMPETSNTYQNSIKLAKLLGCLKEEDNEYFNSFPEEAVECLKTTPFQKLYETANSFLNETFLPFMPSLDSYYLDIEPPLNYISEDYAYSNMKELMTGLVKDEATVLMILMNPTLFKKQSYPDLKTIAETRQMFIDLVTNKTDFSENMVTAFANTFIEGPETDSPKNNVKRFADLLGNIIINCPTIYTADEMVVKNKTVYTYLFNYKPRSSEFGEWLGIVHYSETPFVFGYPLIRPKIYSKKDVEFSKRVMNIWTHFAKTGEAIPQLGKVWPKYSEENSFMVLNPEKSSIIKSLNEKSCNLYKTLIQASG